MISDSQIDEPRIFLSEVDFDHRRKERRPTCCRAAMSPTYLCMRAHLVFLRIFLYLCLRIFLRRFFTTDDIRPP